MKITIKQIFKENKEKDILIKGWVLSNRGNNKIRFITISDGSTFTNLQVVIKNPEPELDKIRLGSSIAVEGSIKLTPNSKQSLELVSNKITLLALADEDYPLQKNGISKEVLREIPHIRHRTNLFRAVMRVRSTLALEVHNFFNSEDFLLVSAPIITSNDGEGAGEAFVVDDESKDLFFAKKATLGVTGQLHAESYAIGFGKVYTFAPTFRAEKSHTNKHAAEFWMIEPEVAFMDLPGGVNLADNMVKTVIKNTIKKHKEEFEFLDKFVEKDLLKKLNDYLEKGVQTLDYSEAIEILLNNLDKFENKDIKFGTDLATEHERFLAETHIGGPVAVVNYPKEIKAFYMHQNDDNKTVAAFDILVPGIGELVGGSQREVNLTKLETRIKELDIDQEDLQWYLDLRRFGDAGSTGFGLGFERLVMYVTGVDNIRDAIPFPRTPKNLKM